jgi:hypothetical protein
VPSPPPPPAGAVCTLLFDGDPVYVSVAVSGIGPTVGKAFGARDQCYQNQSLLQVAVTYDLVNGNDVNFTYQAVRQVDAVDFGTLLQFDTS